MRALFVKLRRLLLPRMRSMQLKTNWAKAVVGMCACGVLYLVYTASWNPPKMTYVQEIPVHLRRTGDYDVWPAFQAPGDAQRDKEWFQQTCLPFRMEISIANLGSLLAHWAQTTDRHCRDLLIKFNTLYAISLRNASLILPDPFQVKVKKWLGNNEELFNDVYHQEIIHVINRYTKEHTIFNPLRDKRPVMPPDEPEEVYYKDIIVETKKSCDFCNFKSYTAEHTFHRVENEYAFSTSNTFKVDTLHALIAMKQHDPLRWTPQSFLGLFNLTVQWFDKAHQYLPSARFPSLIWDVLPKCGASQVHPHLHAFLDPERYHGVVESWRRGGQDYYSVTGTNYFTDMARVASSLGLAVTRKSAVAFASLVPRKDNEVVVMAPKADRDFFELVYIVLRAFVDDLEKYCFSMGLAYPALDGLEAVIPAYARIITRGVITDIRSDISSLELFAATNVNINPFKVAEVVRESAQKRSQAF